MKFDGAGVQASYAPMTKKESHDRAEKIQSEVLVGERWPCGTPDAFRGLVNDKACAVRVGKVKAFSIAVFCQNKSRICGFLVFGEVGKDTGIQRSRLFGPFWFGTCLKSETEERRSELSRF